MGKKTKKKAAVAIVGRLDNYIDVKTVCGKKRWRCRFAGRNPEYVHFFEEPKLDDWRENDVIGMIAVYDEWTWRGKKYGAYTYLGELRNISSERRRSGVDDLSCNAEFDNVKTGPVDHWLFDLLGDVIEREGGFATAKILDLFDAVEFVRRSGKEPPTDRLPAGIIYEFHNKVNGRYYVGQSQYGVRFRYPYGVFTGQALINHNMKIFQDARKYGEDSFTKPKIIDVIYGTKEDLDRAEARYIYQFKGVENGYNRTVGELPVREIADMVGVSMDDPGMSGDARITKNLGKKRGHRVSSREWHIRHLNKEKTKGILF